MKIRLPAIPQRGDYIALTGGLDTVTPPSTVSPGFARIAKNFEEDLNGGYSWLRGYERFDGQPSPSSATYLALFVTNPGSVTVGVTITGAVSGATGKVIAIDSGLFVVTRVTGTFQAETILTYGAAINGGYMVVDAQDAYYKYLAYLDYRGLITPVPGIGKVLGVWYFRGVVYAFRNAAGGGVKLYKSSPTGWQLVPFGFEVAYSGGSGTPPVAGAAIVKGAVSGSLAKITVESGSFSAGTAVGRLIFNSITGGAFSAGAFTSGITATCVSQATISIPNQDGRFQFVTANFFGRLEQANLYGCDGKNRAFEFDGTTFVPINTGLAGNDKPSFIIEHQKHLFLAVGSSVLASAPGDPHNYQTTNGAAEMALSDTVTGFLIQPGSSADAALIGYCRNKIYALYGTDATDWQVIKFSDEAGAMPYTCQSLINAYSLDDIGVLSLTAAQAFGNFTEATVSRRVQAEIDGKRALAVDSCVLRKKQQYRLFYSDGSAHYFTVSGKKVSMMPMQFPHRFTCSCSQEAFGTGDELVFVGDENGYVYQMERGNSFDGQAIDANIELIFNHGKGYRALKKYRRITVEASGTGYSQFNVGYYLGFLGDGYSQPDDTPMAMKFGGARWDQFVWDNFTWDGNSLLSNTLSTPGDAENISVCIDYNSNLYDTVKFNAVFIEYSPLRQMR